MSRSIEFLAELDSIIRQRIDSKSEQSYTAKLAAAGNLRAAQKVGEEGVETALAAATGNTGELIQEAADLTYHLLVLLNLNGIRIEDVVAELEQRHRST